jgi:hypothetical protein
MMLVWDILLKFFRFADSEASHSIGNILDCRLQIRQGISHACVSVD